MLGGYFVTTRLFNRWTNWIVDRPILTILVIVLISAGAIAGHVVPEKVMAVLYPRADEDDESRPRQNVYGSDEEVPDVNPFSLSNAHAVIVVESDALFSADGARSLRQVVKALEALDYVTNVVWMDEIPTANIFGLPEPLLPHETASQGRFDNAREKALRNPLIKGQFLSGDARTMLMLVNFDFFFVEDNNDCIGRLRQVAERAAAEASNLDFTFSVTGSVPLRITASSRHELDKFQYQLIGYGMIAIMALILFRGLSAVLIVAVAPALGVFWTTGYLPYFELQDNPFTDVILPVLVSLVGLTDGVHLMVHIRKRRAAGLSVREAARQGVHEVGLACALTSLTTAIGFGSLVWASHEIVKEFGWCCVLGVVCTFVSVITTIPLLCSSWLGRNVHRGLEKSLIDRNLSRIGELVDLVVHHTRFFSRLAIVTTIILAAIALGLRPDQRRTEGLPDSAEPVVALRKMDRALGGLEFANVRVKWITDVAPDAPEVLTVITKVDELLRSEPLIGHPISIRNLIDALPGDPKSVNRMPMLELLPPELKRAFYTPERRRGNVIFRVQDIGIAKYGPVFERIDAGLAKIQAEHPAFDLDLRGNAVWRSEDLYQILLDMLKSLTSASFIIFIVLTLAYRSLRIGLISIVPNLFPLVLSAAFLVLTGQFLEFVSVCAFTICLGIAVDDTIHFLTRYYEELRHTNDEQEAICRAFTGVGTALIMTTLVLLAGFVTVAFADQREARIFASMGAITIASALLGDLFFLPALLSRFAPVRADEGSTLDPAVRGRSASSAGSSRRKEFPDSPDNQTVEG